jgi:uncharacterized membrane protein YuzA (DUF378 family)
MSTIRVLDAIAFTTVVSGALYLGILGITGLDLIAVIFGEMSFFSRLIYCVIGLAALYQLSQFRFVHKRWAHAESNITESASKTISEE